MQKVYSDTTDSKVATEAGDRPDYASSGSALCVITARGGSKRIPRKNVRDFCGRPIIAYSIEAALTSGIFDEVMVSTDDDEIAEVARRHGASVPFMRSAATSDDYATTADVLLEVLDEYERRGRTFDTLCCVYPTAPFVTAGELREAWGLMCDACAPATMSVTEFDFPPQRALMLTSDGSLDYAYPEYAEVRSQDLPRLVHDCGRFYFAKVSTYRKVRRFASPGCLPFVIAPQLVQDIDNEADWKIAEAKFIAAGFGRRGRGGNA